MTGHVRAHRAVDFPLERVLDAKTRSVSAVLPALDVAATIGDVLSVVTSLRRRGLIDEIAVVDGHSKDGTAAAARAHGVDVYQESHILPEFGEGLGKGDAMWRGLAATSGDIVVYLDTDTDGFSESFVLGLLGPILEDGGLHLIKGAFRRPFKVGSEVLPDAGGRVTELMARPFINLFVPELAGFVQPLAGELAATRYLLERVPFPVGYGVEIAMLIDAWRLVGPDALAQVDLGVRQNRHQPLRTLTEMSYAVLAAASARVFGGSSAEAAGRGSLALPGPDGLEIRQVDLRERPPLVRLRESPATEAATAGISAGEKPADP